MAQPVSERIPNLRPADGTGPCTVCRQSRIAEPLAGAYRARYRQVGATRSLVTLLLCERHSLDFAAHNRVALEQP